MAWTWENEKSLGLGHLDRMATLYRGFEANWDSQRALELADKYANTAAAFEQAAREVRGDAAANLPPVRHKIMCGVATGSGLPCKRRVPWEGVRCWQHPAEGDPGAS